MGKKCFIQICCRYAYIMSATFLATVSVFHEATADYYKYVSEDGIECFTNSPGNQKATLVLRDATKRKSYNGTNAKKLHSLSDLSRPHLNNERSRNLRSLGLPVGGAISSKVGIRVDPIDGLLRNHNGIDIAVPEGTPVKPVAPGVVAYSGMRNGYGNMIIVEHDNGMITIYAHNRTNLVKTGEKVEKNTLLAMSGSTGRSTGPHLHFEAWIGNENITPEFIGGTSIKRQFSVNALKVQRKETIRRVVMADGTLFFTNLPLTHP